MAFAALILEIKNNEDLDQMALAAAQRFSRLPSKYSIGIKKLLNYDKRHQSVDFCFGSMMMADARSSVR